MPTPKKTAKKATTKKVAGVKKTAAKRGTVNRKVAAPKAKAKPARSRSSTTAKAAPAKVTTSERPSQIRAKTWKSFEASARAVGKKPGVILEQLVAAWVAGQTANGAGAEART